MTVWLISEWIGDAHRSTKFSELNGKWPPLFLFGHHLQPSNHTSLIFVCQSSLSSPRWREVRRVTPPAFINQGYTWCAFDGFGLASVTILCLWIKQESSRRSQYRRQWRWASYLCHGDRIMLFVLQYYTFLSLQSTSPPSLDKKKSRCLKKKVAFQFYQQQHHNRNYGYNLKHK